jgi:ABC-type Zn uptake system ZnuABC Zn-binding protein ZnuA
MAACDGDQTDMSDGPGGEKLRAVTSLGIFADFVREVGGERVDVASLLPPGADPHTYELKPKDVQKIAEAHLVFINGLGLEGNLEATVLSNIRQDDRLIYVSGVPDAERVEASEVHRWLDPGQAAGYVSRIRDALIQADPGGDTHYRTRAKSYTRKLGDLDGAIEAQLDSLPASHRRLITYHASFDAFADRYDFEVAGFVVASPGGDPSPRDIADLTHAIDDNDIPAVFAEPAFNSEILDRIAADTSVEVCTLYSDALSDEIPTYVDMMRFNADELSRCLGNAGE